MFTIRTVLFFIILLALPNLAMAQQVWKYGDSTFQVNQEYGQNIEIVFVEPRIGLVNEGVASGTILVTAQGDGKKINGTSHLFRRDCGVIEYHVSGLYDINQGVIYLGGKMPVRNKQCQIEKYQDAIMMFSVVQ